MSSVIFKYTQNIFLAKTEKDFRTLLENLTGYLGMDGYTFFYLNMHKEVQLLDGRPTDFVDYYNEKEWLFFDPVVRTAFQKSDTLLWNKDVQAKTATQKIIMNTAADVGIKDGFLFQIEDGKENGALTFYSNVVGKSTTAVYEEEKLNLQIFTQAFYLAYKNYIGTKITKPRGSPLSERENEILFLMADGLQNVEISRKLSISADTVKEHISKISNKLNSRNRAHSVAIALRNKFIIT